MTRIPVLLLTLLLAAPAWATQQAADACAAKLDGNGKMIYQATAPTFKPTLPIADQLRSATRPLVMAGKMTRDMARPAAEAAANCLQLVSQ